MKTHGGIKYVGVAAAGIASFLVALGACGKKGPEAPPEAKAGFVCSGTPICKVRFFDPIPGEPPRAILDSDRHTYLADDSVAHFVGGFVGNTGLSDPDREIVLSLSDGFTEVARRTLSASEATTGRFEFFVDLLQLSIGNYTATATLRHSQINQTFASSTRAFSRLSGTHPRVAFPSGGVVIAVTPQGVVANAKWPIATGVPFPEGTLRESELANLALLENGARVPAQFIVRATWRPQGGDVKWLGVDFVGRYDGLTPRRYRLVRASSPQTPLPTLLTARQSTSEIVVSTGAVRFVVNRQRFAGIERAWFDPTGRANYPSTRAVTGRGGPFLVDETGVVYAAANFDIAAAADDSGVTIEEQGTQRVTIRAMGWYRSSSGQDLCKFVTRISAYAGSAMVRVSHRTLITCDTTSDRLKDVAWEVVPQDGNLSFAFGQEGGANITGTLGGVNAAGIYLLQDKPSNFRAVWARTGSKAAAGSRASGWLSEHRKGHPAARMTIATKNFHQQYPKELELHRDRTAPTADPTTTSAARMVAHFWPRHGRIVYGSNEHTSRSDIYKLRYAHEGPVLQLTIPDNYRSAVTDYLNEELGDAKSHQDREIIGMKTANGQGLAIGSDFVLMFHAPSATTSQIATDAALFREDPHALASADWNAASGVLGRISAVDTTFDAAAERALALA